MVLLPRSPLLSFSFPSNLIHPVSSRLTLTRRALFTRAISLSVTHGQRVTNFLASCVGHSLNCTQRHQPEFAASNKPSPARADSSSEWKQRSSSKEVCFNESTGPW
ncbi:hypothetical protein PoB_006075200 [Plakobranchus ocellatus]|uniref:Uncharacterized protein n=1 Tax=Plakobranchus ocellatus TaxID=259542 RepID=A0AAV4CQU3_9GAST|nr:hypothetical protein PoB_006075200 [Plakobranchus ocellatus]